jgi:hypothetical protein
MILLRAVIWAMVGLICVPLFVALLEILSYLGLDAAAMVLAAALTGATGAAFYGALQIAVVGTLTGLIVSSLHLALFPAPVRLWAVILVAAIAGLIIGALMRFPARFSEAVPAKSIVGLAAGAVVGVLLLVLQRSPLQLTQIGILTAILIAATGALYVVLFNAYGERLADLLPDRVTEALVCALLAAVPGASLWLIAGPLLEVVDPAVKGFGEGVMSQLPAAWLGGVVGGFVTGGLMEAFGAKWTHAA